MPRIVTTSPHKSKRTGAPPQCEQFNYDHAKQSLATNTKAHQKAQKTTKAYEGHIKRGREYLLKFAAKERQAQADFESGLRNGDNSGEGEEECKGCSLGYRSTGTHSEHDQLVYWNYSGFGATARYKEAFEGEQNLAADPEFVYAFDGEPNKNTPTAIAMFMNYKCFEEGLSGGTAYSVYSAFKWHYESM